MSENKQLLTLQVNGEDHEVICDPRMTLVDVLRHELFLTGTHVGCEHGVCGACTVLVDDKPARACLIFAAQAEGRVIRTVESLGTPEELNDLQEEFSRHHGLQCGFCTPGMLMLAEGFLAEEPNPSREQVRECISANLCRCTGYQTIVDAVECTSKRRQSADCSGCSFAAAVPQNKEENQA
ncbi:(2Fe-2S)-binding protein [Nesterenkonia populi]|uniref:(2Fe-2S)-binding protein n=1 Tax=Nesterenkonia populi TaxID=1591087 RepID=UPI0011BDBB93|nr:(2Fe-2S)-binding protein [Nesterenkonia populi]